MAVSRWLLFAETAPHTTFFGSMFWLNIYRKLRILVDFGRKLGRNSVELVVPEPLGGVPEPNLDQIGPKNDNMKN